MIVANHIWAGVRHMNGVGATHVVIGIGVKSPKNNHRTNRESQMRNKNKVVKIRPSWEVVPTDDGTIVLDFSNIPQSMVDHNKRVSDKVMKEMESKQKL